MREGSRIGGWSHDASAGTARVRCSLRRARARSGDGTRGMYRYPGRADARADGIRFGVADTDPQRSPRS
ncbi:hypothetical protein GCM10028798_27640 [Humibacter antri]